MLKEGDAAPDFKVLTDTGEEFRLADHKSEKIVLYFYPRADTPGCTVESCSFRDSVRKFTKKGVTVIGVSPDTTKALQGEIRAELHPACRRREGNCEQIWRHEREEHVREESDGRGPYDVRDRERQDRKGL